MLISYLLPDWELLKGRKGITSCLCLWHTGPVAKSPLREAIPYNITGDIGEGSLLVEGSIHTVPGLAGSWITELWAHTALAGLFLLTRKMLEPVFRLFFWFSRLGSASISLKVEWNSCLEHDTFFPGSSQGEASRLEERVHGVELQVWDNWEPPTLLTSLWVRPCRGSSPLYTPIIAMVSADHGKAIQFLKGQCCHLTFSRVISHRSSMFWPQHSFPSSCPTASLHVLCPWPLQISHFPREHPELIFLKALAHCVPWAYFLPLIRGNPPGCSGSV